MSYNALILEANFYDVEMNVMKLYTSTDRLAMSCDSFFREGRGLCNYHERRLSVQPGMGLPK